jgi:hypothetical protein
MSAFGSTSPTRLERVAHRAWDPTSMARLDAAGTALAGAALVAKTAHTAAAVANFRMLRLLLDPATH